MGAPGAAGSRGAGDPNAGRNVSRRLPSTPPNLPGFAFIRVLGSGGFADVFLYEQNMPRRLVAVKVLLAEVVNDDLRQMFQAEANLMAQLCSHPSILTVYQASVAADGRPYLVMEYCSATLGQRYRAVQLPLAEVLSIGVRIASAVETAHRQGVLHRDIKPSNILTTAYGHPVLSDFGIAATLGEARRARRSASRSRGRRPEVLHDEVSGTVASEVWSLGATVYSLIAGRSPFEIPGGDNSTVGAHGAHREGQARADRARRRSARASSACSRAPCRSGPQDRQASALEFIRDLQSVEEELGLPQTPLEVAMDDWALATAVDVDERTRIRRPARDRRAASGGADATRRECPHLGHRIGTESRSTTARRARHAHRAADDQAPGVGHLGGRGADRRPRRCRRLGGRAGHPRDPGRDQRAGQRRRRGRDLHVGRPRHRGRRRLHRHDRRRPVAAATRVALHRARRGRRPRLRDRHRDAATARPGAECRALRRGRGGPG